jgi:hypothetical protein
LRAVSLTESIAQALTAVASTRKEASWCQRSLEMNQSQWSTVPLEPGSTVEPF